MAKSDNYLVIFYCLSAGQNGAELGSDEEEIVFLVFWVIDLHSNQVRRFCSWVDVKGGIDLLLLNERYGNLKKGKYVKN